MTDTPELRKNPPLTHSPDLAFGSARETAEKLIAGEISSRELVSFMLDRISDINESINAFITICDDAALEAADMADDLLSTGTSLGVLHGLPVVVKDSFMTEGIRTTSGLTSLADYIPDEDAIAVARLKREGAVIIGKTSVPSLAGDFQTYNDLIGITRNPWDLSRTPGGSTGGVASIASGLGYLEIGSDMAGSIRRPCHFCGVYGHKPSLNVIPLDGHIPPLPDDIHPVTDINVAGPIARDPQDLLLAMNLLGDPGPDQLPAYSWKMPPPRQSDLESYRIGYVLDDPFCPVAADVLEVVEDAVRSLERAGVELIEGWPEGMDPQAALETIHLLIEDSFPDVNPELLYKDWLVHTKERVRSRWEWQQYFQNVDAFILPGEFLAAFPHDTSEPPEDRTLRVDGKERPQTDLHKWVSFASLTGCPATAVPVGMTSRGLPAGIQIIGPYLEDGTPLDIACRMDGLAAGYERPPAFS